MIKKNSVSKIAKEYLNNYRVTGNRISAIIRTSPKFSGNLYVEFQNRQTKYRKYWRKIAMKLS